MITLKMNWTFVKYVLFWLIVHLMCSTTDGGATDDGGLWSDKVHYQFEDNVDRMYKLNVEKVINDFKESTCIDFLEVTDTDASNDKYIKCESKVCTIVLNNTDENKESCKYIETKNLQSAYHELMHLIGFAHEFEREDRPSSCHDYTSNGLKNQSPFDETSIMEGCAQSKRYEWEKSLRDKPTHYDYLSINKAYKCSQKYCTASNGKTCKYDGYVGKGCKCVCVFGFTGDMCTDYDASASSNGCGGSWQKLDENKFHNIKSSASQKYETCIWILTGNTKLTVKITNTAVDDFGDRIEVRHNLLGQQGIRLTKREAKGYTVTNQGDTMVVILRLNMENDDKNIFWFEAKIWEGDSDDEPIESGSTTNDGGDGSNGGDGGEGGDGGGTDGKLPLSFIYIDFEKDDQFRGFNQTGTIEWIRHEGATPTKSTGPGSAAEGRYYAYMESSVPTTSNDYAVLTTAGFYDGKDDVCVQFSYHIFGSAPGTIQVLTKSTDTGTEVAIWTNYDSVSKWRTASLMIVSADVTGSYLVMIKGTPTSIKSDVGIDDVLIGKAPCYKMQAGTTCQACVPAPKECQTADKKVCEQSTVATKFSVVDELKSTSTCTITIMIDNVGAERYSRTCLLSPCKYDEESKNTIIFKSACDDKNGTKCKVCCMQGDDCTECDSDDAAEIMKFSALLLFCIFLGAFFLRII